MDITVLSAIAVMNIVIDFFMQSLIQFELMSYNTAKYKVNPLVELDY